MQSLRVIPRSMEFKAKSWNLPILLEPFTVMVHVNHSPIKHLQSTKLVFIVRKTVFTVCQERC